MVEKKSNSLVVIIILGVVAVVLSVVIWNMGSSINKLDDENRQLQQKINTNVDIEEDNESIVVITTSGEKITYPINNSETVEISATPYKQTTSSESYNPYSKIVYKYKKMVVSFTMNYDQGENDKLTITDGSGKVVYSSDVQSTYFASPKITEEGNLYFMSEDKSEETGNIKTRHLHIVNLDTLKEEIKDLK